MRAYRILSAVITLIFLSVFLLGCIPPPGSREYQPISDWEKREFNKANRDVYPDDVRSDITKYQSVTVAWPGIIKWTEIYQTSEGPDIYFVLEHHYYDWIEDFGLQRERIFLSPRGEGLFLTRWRLVKETTQSEIQDMTQPGKLLIVYGQPQAVQDGAIAVEASYIRFIGKEWYTTEKFDYGRLSGPPKTSNQ